MDPAVDFGLRFGPQPEEEEADRTAAGMEDGGEDADADSPTVVTLDKFRKT